MKTKIIDLNVDYIGGQGSLTDAEEKALSEFFQQRKQTSIKAVSKRPRQVIRPTFNA